MAKLDEVLKLVRLYEEKYRHPSLTRFSVSDKYDLFPGKENMEIITKEGQKINK